MQTVKTAQRKLGMLLLSIVLFTGVITGFFLGNVWQLYAGTVMGCLVGLIVCFLLTQGPDTDSAPTPDKGEEETNEERQNLRAKTAELDRMLAEGAKTSPRRRTDSKKDKTGANDSKNNDVVVPPQSPKPSAQQKESEKSDTTATAPKPPTPPTVPASVKPKSDPVDPVKVVAQRATRQPANYSKEPHTGN